MAQRLVRDPAMDAIRCFALFCVISVHFFLNSGFYDVSVEGTRMFIMVLMRSGFMVCVPLFILLSGYLMRTRTPSRRYYGKIWKTLGIYILASICCLIFKRMYLGNTDSIPDMIFAITGFSAAPYSWYVEMYIGLFLLIPYLNILYNNIPTRQQKKTLILILVMLTGIPSVVNIYTDLGLEWWMKPSTSGQYLMIVPDWWKTVYPLTYYLIGCYLNEYPSGMRKRTIAVIYWIIFAVNGLFNYYRCYPGEFIWGVWQDWESLPILIQTVLVFDFFTKLDMEKLGNKARLVLAKCSDWSFGAYLVSWIFDTYFYGILKNLEPNVRLRLNYFVIIVPVVFICSLVLSGLINGIYRLPGIIRSKQKQKAPQ